MTTSLNLTAGDFTEVTDSLRAYLRQQPTLVDFDFDGSNISALIDLLGYNTYLNLFYHNMAINETFRSTAVLRNNVVARAEEVGYVPRSFRSATATVNIAVSSSTLDRGVVVVPRGTMFTARISDKYFTFTTDERVTLTQSTTNNGKVTFYGTDIKIYEGTILTETFGYSESSPAVIGNEQIDTTSLIVTVVEDNGATSTRYFPASTALGLTEADAVYFLRTSVSGKYEISFGNGVVGKKPKNGALVLVEYRISNGELPNGAKVFNAAQSIDGESDITVTTVTPAAGGAVYESIESIRLSAANALQSQKRATAAPDFAALLENEFAEIVDISAYGGETATPPQYGKVLVSIASTDVDKMPQSRVNEYTKFIRARCSLSIDPVFLDPQYLYVEVNTTVGATKALSPGDQTLKSLVVAAVDEFAVNNLNKFNSPLRYSKLGTAIDNAHPSITGNQTHVRVYKKIAATDVRQGNYSFSFGNVITGVESTLVRYRGTTCKIVDRSGDLVVIAQDGSTADVITTPVGTIDYTTGLVSLAKLALDSETISFNLYVMLKDNDVDVDSKTVLRVDSSQINVVVE